MDKDSRILLTILAKTDAFFWPIRNHQVPGRVLFYERRRDFLSSGIPWRSGATSERARKGSQRELEALAAGGLVTLYNPRGGRVCGVRLTPVTDDTLRRQIGLADYAAALPGLDELYRRRDDPEGFDGLGCGLPAGRRGREAGLPWTSEESLTGIRWGDNEKRQAYCLLTEKFFPLLWRGLVKSNASVQGHVWYGLTTAGYELAQQRAASGQATAKFPPPVPDGDPDAYEFYHAARIREVRAIEAGRPENASELGDIPLPVCPALRQFLLEKTS
jgi:hypothetical protein